LGQVAKENSEGGFGHDVGYGSVVDSEPLLRNRGGVELLLYRVRHLGYAQTICLSKSLYFISKNPWPALDLADPLIYLAVLLC
jgi:hypothetical protein